LFQDISKAFQYSNVLVSGLIEGSAFQQRWIQLLMASGHPLSIVGRIPRRDA
jgi:hypothetical protein